MKGVAICMFVIGFIIMDSSILLAYPGTSSFWFSLTDTNPDPVITALQPYVDDTITLYAWAILYEGECQGLSYPIIFDTIYLQPIAAAIDSSTFNNWEFIGCNWPYGDPPGPENPNKILWYGVSFFSTIPDSTPFCVGYVTFIVIQEGNHTIDTTVYPPGNRPELSTSSGNAILPDWYQINFSPPSGIFTDRMISQDKTMLNIHSFGKTVLFEIVTERSSHYSLLLFDILGRFSEKLYAGYLTQGRHQFLYQPKTNGVYFCVLKEKNEVVRIVRKVIFFK